MILDQRQVLIKEDFESSSTVYDAAEMRELLARAGASYTLLDGSSLSPIPFVEGRQSGPNLELLLPDGTIIIIREFFGDMGTPYSPQTMLAQFGPETAVYFPDYIPNLTQAAYGGVGFAGVPFGAAAPAAAAGGISPAMLAMGAAAPAAALLAPTPEGGDINVMTTVGGVGGTVVTTPQPSIKSIALKLSEVKLADGDVIGQSADLSATTVTVTSLNLEEGDEIKLRLFQVSGDNTVFTAIQSVDSDGKVTFEIDQSLLENLGDDDYEFVAYLGDDENISKSTSFSVDSTPPTFFEFVESDEFFYEEGIDGALTEESVDGQIVGIALAQDLSDVEYFFVDDEGQRIESDLFVLNSFNGSLEFVEPPIFDSDNPHNNTYDLRVRALDAAGNYSTKSITIEITEAPEDPAAGSPTVDPILGLTNGYVNKASYEDAGFPNLTGTSPQLEANQSLQIVVADADSASNSAVYNVAPILKADGTLTWSLDLDNLPEPPEGTLILRDGASYTATARIATTISGQEPEFLFSASKTFSIDRSGPDVKLWIETESDNLAITQADLDSSNPAKLYIRFTEAPTETPDFATLFTFTGIVLGNVSSTSDPRVYVGDFTLVPDFEGTAGVVITDAASFSDAAGNPLTKQTEFSPKIDSLAPGALGLRLSVDSGNPSDNITNGKIRVTGLEEDAALFYSTDSGESFTELTKVWKWDSDNQYFYHDVDLPDFIYNIGSIQAYQVDVNGNQASTDVWVSSDKIYEIDSIGPVLTELEITSTLNSDLTLNKITVTVHLNDGDTWLSQAVTEGSFDFSENSSYVRLSNIAQSSGSNLAYLKAATSEGDGSVTLTFELEGASIENPKLEISVSPDNMPIVLDVNSTEPWVMDTAGNPPRMLPKLPDTLTPFDPTVQENMEAAIDSLSHTSGIKTDTTLRVYTFGAVGKKVELDIDGDTLNETVVAVETLQYAEFDLSSLNLPDSAELPYKVSLLTTDSTNSTDSNDPRVREGTFVIDEAPPENLLFTLDKDGALALTDEESFLKENQNYSAALFWANAEDDSEISFSLEDPANIFQIDYASGAISLKPPFSFDFETLVEQGVLTDSDGTPIPVVSATQREGFLTMTITATDAALNASEKELKIKLVNLDETPPVFDEDASYEVEISRDQSTEHAFFTPLVTDIFEDIKSDVVDIARFSLIDDSELFEIDETTGGISLSPDKSLPAAATSKQVEITAKGQDGASASKTLTIKIPGKEVPPNFTEVLYGDTDLMEGKLNEVTLKLVDIFENPSAAQYWTIRTDDAEAELALDGRAAQYFTLTQIVDDPEAWELSLNTVGQEDLTALDFETIFAGSEKEAELFEFTITAKDLDNQTATKKFSFNLYDDGQNPVFQNQNQTITTTELFAGTELSTAVELATQSSGGSIEYTLLETTDSSIFDFVSETGLLKANTDLIYDSGNTSYDLTLLADYNGETSTADITVNVIDSAPGPDIIGFSWAGDYSPTAPVNPTDKVNLKVTFDGQVSPPDVKTGYLLLQFVDDKGKTYLQTVNFDGVAQPNDDEPTLVFSVYPPYAVSTGKVFLREIQPEGSMVADLIPEPIELEYGEAEDSNDWVFDTEMPQIESVVISESANTLTLKLTHEFVFRSESLDYTVKKIDSDTDIWTDPQFTDRKTLVFNLTDVRSFPESLDEVMSYDLTFLINASRASNQDVGVDQTLETEVIRITAGQFVTDSLIVKACDLDGELLGETDFNPLNGIIDYVDLMPTAFTGPAIINILDGSAELDYLDEFTNTLIDYGRTTEGFGLRVLVEYHDGIALEPVSVTPLTELALRLAEANSALELDVAYDQAVGQLYTLFNLTDTRGDITVTTADEFDTADGITAAESQGLVLAALSTLDNLTGGINATLELLDPANGFDQHELDLLIADAIQAVASSENPYVQQIAPELTQVLEQFYDYHQFVIAPTSAPEVGEPNTDLLDLSAYLSDESDFEMLIDGEIQELSTTSDAIAAAQPSTTDSILNNTQVVTPAGVDHIDAETDVNIYG